MFLKGFVPADAANTPPCHFGQVRSTGPMRCDTPDVGTEVHIEGVGVRMRQSPRHRRPIDHKE